MNLDSGIMNDLTTTHCTDIQNVSQQRRYKTINIIRGKAISTLYHTH